MWQLFDSAVRLPMSPSFLFNNLGKICLRVRVPGLGTKALHGESDMASDGDGEAQFFIGEDVRRVIIGHELPNESCIHHEGNECERADPFPFHHTFQGFRNVGNVNVTDPEGLRVRFIALPG